MVSSWLTPPYGSSREIIDTCTPWLAAIAVNVSPAARRLIASARW
jgi:hypothetical protein